MILAHLADLAARLRGRDGVHGFVEGSGPRALRGWAYAAGPRAPRFEVRVRGRWVPVHVERHERADVHAARPEAGPWSGFRLVAAEHPSPWSDAPTASIEVRVNGRRLHWTARPSGDAGTVPPAPPDDPAQLRLEQERRAAHWALLRRVNAAVDAGAGIAAALRAALEQPAADPEAVARLGESVAPLLLDTTDAQAAGRLLEPLATAGLRPGALRDPWRASLVLAALAQAGAVLPATAVAWRLGSLLPAPGWLSTECVRYAASRLLAAHAAGAVSDARIRLFLHALLRLFRLQRGQWFSRLPDEHLAHTLASMLAHAGRSGDPELLRCHRREALRSAALNPAFWRCARAAGLEGDAALHDACETWERVRGLFDAGARFDPARAARLEEACAPLLAMRCADAAQLSREARAAGRNPAAEGLPRELWPTYAPPGVAPAGRLEWLGGTMPAGAAPLVVCVVRDERAILPHFLAHYRGLGAGGFLFVDNGSTDGTREYLLAQPDAALYGASGGYRDAFFGVAWQQALLGNLCAGRWVLVVDADEFLVYDGCESLSLGRFVAAVDAAGADAVFTDLVDMYPRGALDGADLRDGPPFAIAPWFDRRPLRRWWLGGGRFSNAPSYVSALRHRLVPDAEPNSFLSQKCALFRYRPWVRLAQGLHDVAGVNPHATRVWLAHFKYHAQFGQRVRVEIDRMQHFDGAREYRHYEGMLRESRGDFWRPEVSVRFEGSASFRDHAGSGGPGIHMTGE